MTTALSAQDAPPHTLVNRLIRFCLENRLVVFLFLVFIAAWGIRVMPFGGIAPGIPRDPIPIDAIPDIGENQQVVFTEWPGRSPQDVENQITFPLTTVLQGTPGFRAVRSYSMFGFSVIYVIFDDQFDFFWCRSRLAERLTVARRDLPDGVNAQLGPEATALGQVYWYTLEGSHGGFDPMELRSIQDWYVKRLLRAPGVADVASVGGFVREYQVDIDPAALRTLGVRIQDVFEAVELSNKDIGAETLELNGVEYILRSRGFIRSESDIENILIRREGDVPIYVKQVGRVQVGPALRRGVLDKNGEEAVGGVVLARYGENPLDVISAIQAKIEEISPGLPRKTLADGTVSQVRIVPFYDRSGLIHETMNTLRDALWEEVLVTTFVVMLFLRRVRSCLVIAATMPIAILICFILMKVAGVDSNLMSLAGIAIAIGTMDDMGIILTENIVRHLEADTAQGTGCKPMLEIVYEASSEIGSAITTAILMTVVAFLPVFALEGAEGKLFQPLAFTKTFALVGSLLAGLLILPALALTLFSPIVRRESAMRWMWAGIFAAAGIILALAGWIWAGVAAGVYGAFLLVDKLTLAPGRRTLELGVSLVVMAGVLFVLTMHWMPLGPGAGFLRNLVLVLIINLGWASVRLIYIDFYPAILRFFLAHKITFVIIPATLTLLGLVVWLGFARTVGRLLPAANSSDSGVFAKTWSWGSENFPGLGREFMPPLDEGSFLYMPTLMPHTGMSAALSVISAQDRALQNIPEVESVVGKLGRAETPLDPAPLSMVETVVNYKSEYKRDSLSGDLVVDESGQPIRQWRSHIRNPGDIWKEVQQAADFPGVTGAPVLQPISARLVMLQSGMRAAMGVKIFGSDLKEIEKVGYAVADILQSVPGIAADAIIPDRISGKPYLEIELHRDRLARYGITVEDAQDSIEMALGGSVASRTIEGRERYAVRIRYLRELRDNPEAVEQILIGGADGEQVPLSQLATIHYVRGPEDIKGEDSFLVSYVLFDKKSGFAEVDVVEAADRLIKAKISSGELALPSGVHYKFAGNYENQVRFQRRLSMILPLSLFLLFLLLYWEFRSIPISLIVFSGIPIAWAGGFIGLWLIAEPWFLNFSIFGENLRDLFHFGTYNLSAAVWVGFIALFSVTTDDGVVLATYLRNEFDRHPVAGIADIREAVVAAGTRRVRPCLMTAATTVLSLMPVLTSDGRGADLMIPIALPSIGGLTIELLSLFVLPVCYCMLKEWQWRFGNRKSKFLVRSNAI